METWKDTIMNSLDGLEKASPANDVFTNIQERIHAQKAKYARDWVAVAAAVLLVVGVNGYFVLNDNKEQDTTMQTTQAATYPGIVSHLNIYE